MDNEEVLQVLQVIQQQDKIGIQKNVTLILTVHTALLCFINRWPGDLVFFA